MAVVKSIARDVHVGDPAIAMSGLVFATSVAILRPSYHSMHVDGAIQPAPDDINLALLM